MSICLPFKNFIENLCYKNQNISKKISEKKKCNPFLIIFPSFCDVLATILDSTGLIYVWKKKFKIKRDYK